MPAFRKNYVYAGRYQLEKLIGEGGFSEVWSARDTMANDAIVAVKIYAPEKGLDDYGIRQFRKEYSIAFDLSHPHLMKVLHFDICNGSPYLIMPYFPLGSVSHYVQDNGVLSEKQLACVMYQIGGALEELHSQQPPVLHQDIKPDNILMRNKEHFVLTDFGISHKTRHTITKATGSINSLTIAYSPPERFDTNPKSSEASDIFSLGVSLYEMCTGVIPWDGHGGQSLLHGARTPDLPPKFSRELDRVLHACMALTPGARPSAQSLKNLGKHFLDKGNWKFEELKKKSSNRLKKEIAFLVVVSIALISFALIFNKSRTNPDTQSHSLDTTATDTSVSDLPVSMPNKDSVPPDISAKHKSASRQSSIVKKEKTKDPERSVVESTQDYYRNLTVDSIQYYLDALSDQTIARSKRGKLKKNVLALFDSGQAIIERNGTTSIKHGADIYLTLLMDSVHHIKVVDVIQDKNHKIKELHIRVINQNQL